MTQLPFKGGTIVYEVSGKGNAVVFLHGFLESRSIFNPYLQQLSASHRVISIDLPGHGESSCFGYCHSMEFMAEAVMAVLHELKVRRFHLVGHSMGGYVAMALAEEFPDNIRGICMFHSTSQGDSEAKKKERNKVIKVVGKNKELFVRQAIPNLFNTAYKPYKRLIEQYKKAALAMPVQGIVAALEGMKIRNDRQIVLKFAPYPVLFIIGKHDNILPAKMLLSEVESSENAYSLVLENAGHMGFEEEPESCFQAIRSFLKK